MINQENSKRGRYTNLWFHRKFKTSYRDLFLMVFVSIGKSRCEHDFFFFFFLISNRQKRKNFFYWFRSSKDLTCTMKHSHTILTCFAQPATSSSSSSLCMRNTVYFIILNNDFSPFKEQKLAIYLYILI